MHLRRPLLAIVLALPLAWWASAAAPAVRSDGTTLDRTVKQVLAEHGDGIEASIWVGGTTGAPWYAWQASTPRPPPPSRRPS